MNNRPHQQLRDHLHFHVGELFANSTPEEVMEFFEKIGAPRPPQCKMLPPGILYGPTRQVKAEDVQVGMVIAIQGYWFRVLETNAEVTPAGITRQISRVEWSGFGMQPPSPYDSMNHGLKHGEIEIVLAIEVKNV